MSRDDEYNEKYLAMKHDYSILQLSQHQFFGVSEVVDIVNDYLNIDREILVNIAHTFMIKQQIQAKKYYFELAHNLPQARLTDKFEMGNYVISELKILLEGKEKAKFIEKAVNKAFDRYINDFLQQKRD